MGENWVVLVALELSATDTASVESSVASVAMGVVIVKLCVIFGIFIGIEGGIVIVAADMLTVGFQSLYKYNTHDKQAQ